MRLVLSVVSAAILFGVAAWTPAAENPLGAAPVDPVVGSFSGEKFSLMLKTDGGRKYVGVIQMGGKEFPAIAAGEPKALKGSFKSDGQDYEFSAALDGETLTFSSGGLTYSLKKQGNPLGGGSVAIGGQPAARGPVGKLEVVQSTQTGQTLFEAKEGARSAKGALADAVNDLSAYLGTRPSVAGAFADTKDLRGGACFTAKVRDRAIKGMIFVGIGDKGAAITVVIDAADAPNRNLAALAGALPVELKWETAQLPDGSGAMKLPTGWRITAAVNGAVDVVGPDGQAIDLGLAIPVLTPEADRAAKQQQLALGIRPTETPVPIAPYPADAVKGMEELVPIMSRFSEAAGGPAIKVVKVLETAPSESPGGTAAFMHVVSDHSKGATVMRYHSVGWVACMPMPLGQWYYYTSSVTAPEATFARDLPVMMQIWASWKVSDTVLQARLTKAMESMKEAGDIITRSNAYASKVRSNSNADFDEVIIGYRTVEDTETGERHEANLGYVDKIVEKLNEHAGYNRYKEIPLRDQ